jgi:hypothetical protein
MEYKEIYRKKLSLAWKAKRLTKIVVVVVGLAVLAIWTLAQQEGLMVGKVLPGTSGQQILGK